MCELRVHYRTPVQIINLKDQKYNIQIKANEQRGSKKDYFGQIFSFPVQDYILKLSRKSERSA